MNATTTVEMETSIHSLTNKKICLPLAKNDYSECGKMCTQKKKQKSLMHLRKEYHNKVTGKS